jgi:hypothetical protein
MSFPWRPQSSTRHHLVERRWHSKWEVRNFHGRYLCKRTNFIRGIRISPASSSCSCLFDCHFLPSLFLLLDFLHGPFRLLGLSSVGPYRSIGNRRTGRIRCWTFFRRDIGASTSSGSWKSPRSCERLRILTGRGCRGCSSCSTFSLSSFADLQLLGLCLLNLPQTQTSAGSLCLFSVFLR